MKATKQMYTIEHGLTMVRMNAIVFGVVFGLARSSPIAAAKSRSGQQQKGVRGTKGKTPQLT